MVGEAIEQRGGHLCIAEDGGPFAEAEIGGDDHAGSLVELAQQMEQKGAAGRAERQVAQFIEDHEVETDQAFGDLAGLAPRLFLLERVDEFDGGEEADLAAMVLDDLDADGGGEVRLPGAGAVS